MPTPFLQSDQAFLADFGQRLLRRRLTENLTQAELAAKAGVSKRTVERLESGVSTQFTNLIRTLRALGLGANLAALIPPPVASPIAQLRRQKSERLRATTPSKRGLKQNSGWTWGKQP